MSFELYSKWWAGTRQTLEKLKGSDELIVKKAKGCKNRLLAGTWLGGLYAKYAMIVQSMGTVLDQMAQPQKRITARKLMDAATARLHELNEELRKIDISEYHYIDGNLVELKLIPHDVEVIDPDIFYYLRDYTVEDLWKRIKNGERIYEPPPPPPPPPPEPENGEAGEAGDAPATDAPKEEEPPPPEEPKKEKKPL